MPVTAHLTSSCISLDGNAKAKDARRLPFFPLLDFALFLLLGALLVASVLFLLLLLGFLRPET